MSEKDFIAEQYGLMKTAESNRQILWIAAYNKNPELAASLIRLFDMDEEDIRLIVRVVNSIEDGLMLYKRPTTTKKKKPVHNIKPQVMAVV